jgi:hypothetical protein
MTLQVAYAFLQSLDIFVSEFFEWLTTMHLKGTDGSDHDDGIWFEASGTALNV